MVLIMTVKPPANPQAEADGIAAFMSLLDRAFSQLVMAGISHEAAHEMFAAQAETALRAMDPHGMRPVIQGVHRLDAFASDTNRDLVSRQLAQAIQGMDPKHIHRVTLDANRKAAPPAKTIGGKVKDFGFKVVRSAKATARELDADYGKEAQRSAQVAGEREHYRSMVDTAMKDLVRSTQPGVVQSNSQLARHIDQVAMAQVLNNATELDEAQWVTGMEDSLARQSTERLVSLANRLVTTVPDRLSKNEYVEAIGRSLHAVIKLRPGCEALAAALQAGALSGSAPLTEARTYCVNHLAEQMSGLVAANAEDSAVLLDDLERADHFTSDFMRGSQAAAVETLPKESLQGVKLKLEAAPHPRSVATLLAAVEARLAQAV